MISDEIYALSVFDSQESGAMPFVSTLSINTEGLMDEKLLHVIYGMSKVSMILFAIACLITADDNAQRTSVLQDSGLAV